MKPIIGIIGKSDYSSGKKTSICVLDNYRKAIINYGGIPIAILPPQIVDYEKTSGKEVGHLTEEEMDILNSQLKLCDGLLLQGGSRSFDYHKYACKYANEFNIPLLGICMGMQVMCNYDNDNQNIENEDKIHKSPGEDIVHEVSIKKDSILYDIIKKENITVNSNHNYHVTNSGSYKISALSFDNLIEGIEKDGTFNIGIQWHPEKQYESEESKALFKAFIKSTKK